MNMMTTMEPPRAAPHARRSRRKAITAAMSTTARMERLGALFAAFDRDDMEAGVDLLIAALDHMDGDTDREPNGDELDGSIGEDDFHHMSAHDGAPGCPVSDPGGGDANDEAGDPAWIEWQTRGRHKVDAFGAELLARDRYGNIGREDEEEDDPREANGDECDTGNAEDDHGLVSLVGGWSPQRETPGSRGAGCPISDPGGCEHDGREEEQSL